MKSILDPSFRYTASFNTDLKKTFARIRCEHRNDAEGAVQATANALSNVSSMSESQRLAADQASLPRST
jgi:hypothetical protein